MSDTNDNFTSAITVEDDGSSLGPVQATEALPGDFGGDFAPLAQLLGYDVPTDGQKEQLEYVWDYFKEEGKGPGETLAALRDLERSLGSPEIGQTKLDRLYSYIRLSKMAEDLDLERQAYLR